MPVPRMERSRLATSSAGRWQGSESPGQLWCPRAAPAWLRVAASSGCPEPKQSVGREWRGWPWRCHPAPTHAHAGEEQPDTTEPQPGAASPGGLLRGLLAPAGGHGARGQPRLCWLLWPQCRAGCPGAVVSEGIPGQRALPACRGEGGRVGTTCKPSPRGWSSPGCLRGAGSVPQPALIPIPPARGSGKAQVSPQQKTPRTSPVCVVAAFTREPLPNS